MDIGKMNDNYTFYEGEPEIVLRVAGTESAALHIWEGYIDDLFAEPMLTGTPVRPPTSAPSRTPTRHSPEPRQAAPAHRVYPQEGSDS